MDLPAPGPRAVLMVAVAVGVAAACGRASPAETRVEAELRRSVAAALELPVARVRCGGSTVRCVATVDGVEVPLAIHDAGSELGWEVDGLVVRVRVLEAEVRAMLDELVVTATIDCGPRVQVVAPGARVACEIRGATRGGSAAAGSAGSDAGRAWATVAADGSAALELALGADAVSARTDDLATRDLDALSRALDRDDAGGDEDEPAGSAATTAGSGSAAMPDSAAP